MCKQWIPSTSALSLHKQHTQYRQRQRIIIVSIKICLHCMNIQQSKYIYYNSNKNCTCKATEMCQGWCVAARRLLTSIEDNSRRRNSRHNADCKLSHIATSTECFCNCVKFQCLDLHLIFRLRSNVVKTSCRTETSRHLVSLNILLSHSKSFEMTLLSRSCVSHY